MLEIKLGNCVDVGVGMYPLRILPTKTQEDDGTWPLFMSYLQQCWLQVPGVDAKEFFGFPVGSNQGSVHFPGFAPVNYAYDPIVDYERYSFPLGEALRQISRSKGMSSGFESEKLVHHFSCDGHVRPKGNGLHTFIDELRWGATLRTARPIDGGGYVRTHQLAGHSYPTSVGSTMSLTSGTYSLWERRPLFELFDWMDRLWLQAKKSRTTAYLTGPNGPRAFTTTVGSFAYSYGEWSHTDTGCSFVEYRTNAVTRQMRRMKVDLNLSVVANTSVPSLAIRGRQMYDVRLSGSYKARWYYYNVSLPGEIPFFTELPPYSANNFAGSFDKTYTGCQSFPTSRPYQVDESVIHELFSDSLSMREFYTSTLAAYRWLRPSVNSVLADISAEFFSKAANWLEFFAECDELLELFPREQLEQAMYSVSEGNRYVPYLSERFRAIARAISGGYLLYSFGWSPLVGTPEQAVGTLGRLADRYDALRASSVVRGRKSFRFSAVDKLPSGIIPDELVTRTKVTVGGFNDSFSSSFVDASSLGFVPSSENLWDLGKGSWLIDYFANLTDRYAVLDAYVALSLMDARNFVHSFTLLYNMSDERLAPFGLEGCGRPPKFTLYCRDVSRYVPALFNAETASLFIEEGHVKWGIVLAILAQLIV